MVHDLGESCHVSTTSGRAGGREGGEGGGKSVAAETPHLCTTHSKSRSSVIHRRTSHTPRCQLRAAFFGPTQSIDGRLMASPLGIMSECVWP
ncbi:hypothetical protein MPTK2_1g13060 [Marchantia polymorpha subsp. ruderalis]